MMIILEIIGLIQTEITSIKVSCNKDHLKFLVIPVRQKLPKTAGRNCIILKDDLKTCQTKRTEINCSTFYMINIINLKLEDPIRQQIQDTGCTNIQI